jgi:uncharacterized membrane protein YvbJ
MFCSKCGAENDNNAVYCQKCGTNLKEKEHNNEIKDEKLKQAQMEYYADQKKKKESEEKNAMGMAIVFIILVVIIALFIFLV